MVWCHSDGCMPYIIGEDLEIWQKVMHDEEKNTYTFWKDGSKVILLPLEDEGKVENVFSERDIVKEMMEIGFYYALIVKKGIEEDIKYLLNCLRY